MSIVRRVDVTGRTPAMGYRRFGATESIDYQLNRWAEWIGATAVEPLAALAGDADGTPGLVDGLLALADRAQEGDPVAGAYYARAAALFMAADDARRRVTRRRFVDTMCREFGAVVERVPFAGGSLPCYDLRPVEQRGEPIVVFGGFDSWIEEFFPLLYALVDAGRRVIAFDGPGQGGALEDSGLVMTPEWAAPTATVLDHFDTGRVTAVGISLGGALVMRAAAFEPRIARVVAFDVCDDQLDTATDRLGPAAAVLRGLLRLRARTVTNLLANAARRRDPALDWSLGQGMHVTGSRSPYDFLRAAATVETASCSDRIRADVLLLAGAEDHLIPRRMLARQAGTLTAARSVTTRLFTSSEQASSHCRVGNTALAARTIDTWIAERERAAQR